MQTLLKSALAGAVLALVGCSGSQAPKESLQAPGALLYNGYTKSEVACYKCHDGDASGSLRGPNLIKKLKKISDDEYFAALHKGPLLMPSYTETLTEEEMKAILEWLRSF